MEISRREQQDKREAAFNNHLREASRAAGVGWRQGGIGSLEGLREEMVRTGSPDAALQYRLAKLKYITAKKQGRL
jgi:hypothetical protein